MYRSYGRRRRHNHKGRNGAPLYKRIRQVSFPFPGLDGINTTLSTYNVFQRVEDKQPIPVTNTGVYAFGIPLNYIAWSGDAATFNNAPQTFNQFPNSRGVQSAGGVYTGPAVVQRIYAWEQYPGWADMMMKFQRFYIYGCKATVTVYCPYHRTEGFNEATPPEEFPANAMNFGIAASAEFGNNTQTWIGDPANGTNYPVTAPPWNPLADVAGATSYFGGASLQYGGRPPRMMDLRRFPIAVKSGTPSDLNLGASRTVSLYVDMAKFYNLTHEQFRSQAFSLGLVQTVNINDGSDVSTNGVPAMVSISAPDTPANFQVLFEDAGTPAGYLDVLRNFKFSVHLKYYIRFLGPRTELQVSNMSN